MPHITVRRSRHHADRLFHPYGWEATVSATPYAWDVAYGRTRWHARRKLNKIIGGK